ncbi:hypothetical protein [Owenweeksia hongkongensis]|uniref:hypothetical protein n=1 Tax=Owenweeksia hongkongensis TaxID=253245 RepID=UPI003A934B4F
MTAISTKQDQSTATQVLAEAYQQAPNISWAVDSSSKKLNYFFSSLLKDAIAKDGAYITSNSRGVLLLYDMKASSRSISSVFRKLHLMIFVIGIKKSMQLMKLEKLKKRLRPKSGLYGMALAILDDEHRWQTALEVKQGFLEISKKKQLPIYVETTNERIVKLYEIIGFDTYHKMRHPYTELNVWFMKMESRPEN